MVHKTFSISLRFYDALLSISLLLFSLNGWSRNSPETVLPPLVKTGVPGTGNNIHLALWAFWADVVTLPAPDAFLSTDLMTPIATVCLTSRTAKRQSEELSTHKGACQEPINSGRQHHHLSRIWGHLPEAPSQNSDQSSPSGQQPCKLRELSCGTIQHGCVASTDLAWMAQDNHLSCDAGCFHHSWLIFAVRKHKAIMASSSDRHALDTEVYIVSEELHPRLHAHFNRLFFFLNFSCNDDWAKVITCQIWEPQSATGPQGQYPYYLERQAPRACPLDKWVAGCHSELSAAWFHWHCHLYRGLSITWTKAC